MSITAPAQAIALACVDRLRDRDLTINRELKIVHRKDKHLSRAALSFIEMARRY